MIVVAVLALTAFHPGYFFPQMSAHKRVAPNGIVGEKELSDGESPSPNNV